MFGLIKNWRRKKTRALPFPDLWRHLLSKHVAHYRRLSDSDKRLLETHILVFLREKRFEGCGGMKITDEVRLVIASQACLLLLGRDGDYFPRLSSIVVYPTAFVAPIRRHEGAGLITEGTEVREGESWGMGTVVLSWDDVVEDSEFSDDGRNVVIHEFAHQVDEVDDLSQKGPFPREYDRFVRMVERDQETFLDEYGSESPHEFFAVVTEEFFERPRGLCENHPELFAFLRDYFGRDPS